MKMPGQITYMTNGKRIDMANIPGTTTKPTLVPGKLVRPVSISLTADSYAKLYTLMKVYKVKSRSEMIRMLLAKF